MLRKTSSAYSATRYLIGQAAIPPRWRRVLSRSSGVLCLFLCVLSSVTFGEDGHAGWLRYARLKSETAKKYSTLPATAIILGNSMVLQTAQAELLRGISGMLDKRLRIITGAPTEPV